MRLSRHVLTVFLLLSAGCGGTMYLSVDGKSPRPPVEVFDCVKSQVQVLGYTQASIDVDAHRLTARKNDWDTRIADTQFRRMVDRLSIEVGKPADGSAPLKIKAHTFALLDTHRGPTEVEQEASQGVRAAAQALLEACGK
jgi:hypothetical protein